MALHESNVSTLPAWRRDPHGLDPSLAAEIDLTDAIDGRCHGVGSAHTQVICALVLLAELGAFGAAQIRHLNIFLLAA